MATKRGRLAVIIVLWLAVSGSAYAWQRAAGGDVERAARSLAASVRDELGAYDRGDLDELLAEDATAGWGGRPSPFTVDGRSPERKTEIRGGFVARYRVDGVDERCVDALWPDDAPFSVTVNDCHRYEPPTRR